MKRHRLESKNKFKKRLKNEESSSPSKEEKEKPYNVQHHILNFSRLTENEKSSNPFAGALSLAFLYESKDQGGGEDEDIYTTIAYLSSFLTSNMKEDLVSKAHIARLVFPWVTQALLQQKENSSPLIWKAFSLSLEMLLRGSATMVSEEEMKIDYILESILVESKDDDDMRGGDTNANSSDAIVAVLSQGVMNKLIPCFVRTSFHSRKKGDTQIIAMAAKSFGLIANSEIYRPTMDYVCNVLIPLVYEHCLNVEIIQDGTAILPNQSTILYFSMQLLVTLKSRGRATNPKKTFQLVSSSHMLTCMAHFCCSMNSESSAVDIILIVNKVLSFAFYDTFHLNGFRSINQDIPILNKEIQLQGGSTEKNDLLDSKKSTSAANSSYLESLFNAIKSMFDNQSEQKINIGYLSRFIPILLGGYMRESLRSDNASTKRKMRVDVTAKLQFRFFGTLIHPVLKMINSKENELSKAVDQVAILQTILQCTDLLLKYDVYLPSFADPGNQHLNFIIAIGEVVLALAERQTTTADPSEHMNIIHRLFMLSHLTYHQKIPRVIMCATKNSMSSDQESSSVKLLCALCTTYKKLRQMDHLIKAILTYGDGREQVGLASRSFIHNDSFISSLSSSIQSSPIGQTQTVWDLVNEHITTSIKNVDSEAVEYSIKVFRIILKSVRVGPYSSKAIKEMCEGTMATSVSTLLSPAKNPNRSSSMDGFDLTCDMAISGLDLWGWIVHVHTKCCFWLNEMPHEKETDDAEDSLCGSKLVPTLINSINFLLSSSIEREKSLEALQLLACHLLQQLHSSIYQQEQIEALSVEKTTRRSSSMIKEAKLLVKFVVRAACSKMAGWKILCENLVNWVPYAEEAHIDLFLHWFFMVQATEESDKSSDTIRSEERAAAMALNYDASFVEARLFHRSAHVAMSCIQKTLYGNTSELPTNPRGISVILSAKAPKLKSYNVRSIKEVSSIVNTLRLLISTLGCFKDMYLAFEITLLFHNDMFRFLCSCVKSAEYEDSVELLCSYQYLLSAMLIKESTKYDDYTASGKSVIPKVLKHIFSSINETIEEFKNTNPSLQLKLIKSGSKFCYSAVMFSINSFGACAKHIESLAPIYEDLSNGDYPHHVVVQIIRPSLHLLLKTADLKAETSFTEKVHQIARALSVTEKDYCIRHIEKALCDNKDNTQSVSDFAVHLYFISDLLAMEQVFSRQVADHGGSSVALERIFKKVVNILKSQKILDTSTYSAMLYFFGSLVGKDLLPSSMTLTTKLEVQKIAICQYQNSKGRTHPVVDSTYAKILCNTTPEELSDIVKELLIPSTVNNGGDYLIKIAAVINCFHTMVHVLKGRRQRQIISSAAKQVLSMTSCLIYPFRSQKDAPYEGWSIQLRTAQALILTLIEKSDLVVLKGFDVSNILATITTIFCKPAASDSVTFIAIDKNVYASSCAIMTSLLKYYPKQVYGCVPSFTSALRCLLHHVMTHKREEENDILIFQDLGKICELLPEHKDIFKKHMMHLVLYYVDGIENIMGSETKTQLEPSVFFLLDTLSEFETKQMNTLMNATGKALFQSVFKSYRKYQYKGQF